MNLDTAIKVSQILEKWYDNYPSKFDESTVSHNAKFLIDNLIDRDTEKQPILMVHRVFFKERITYICPNCSNHVLTHMANERQDNRFCFNCGQRLDWSIITDLEEGNTELVWHIERKDKT